LTNYVFLSTCRLNLVVEFGLASSTCVNSLGPPVVEGIIRAGSIAVAHINIVVFNTRKDHKASMIIDVFSFPLHAIHPRLEPTPSTTSLLAADGL
jgi:hypothetical protein